MNKVLLNILLSIISIIFCLLAGEIYFRFFYVHSDNFGFTLSHKKWGEKYWKPINSYGLRDREWEKKDLNNKKVIVVVGDSIAAGHGIKDISDRFSDILANKLGSEYVVANVSNPGWGSEYEINALAAFPYNIDLVIWAYFPNDIIDTSLRIGKKLPLNIQEPKGIIGEIINSSYLLNFVYWRLYKFINLNDDHFQWIKEQYEDPVTWSAYEQTLNQVHGFIVNKGYNYIIVSFPFLNKNVDSDFAINKIHNFFNKRGVRVLDVSQLIADLEQKDIVVSKDDLHPSKKLHKLVGDSLYTLVNRHFVDSTANF